MLETILFLFGLAGLWGGTVLTVGGAVDVSERHGLSHGFIGLTILAIGTDLPELLVSVSGSIHQLRGVETSGVIVGNAIGSAMAQGTLVLGVAGLFGYLGMSQQMIRRDGLTLLLAIGLTSVLTFGGGVGRLEGAALVIAYLIYFVALVQAEHGQAEVSADTPGPSPVFALLVGLVTVVLSAHVVVSEGIAFAERSGLSQTVVGALIIALGTSLPELALAIGAARKGHASLSVGNIIGSNIFDLLIPVGVAAMIHPLVVVRSTTSFDLPAVAIATAALLLFMSRKRGLQRPEAFALIGLYVGYAALRLLVIDQA
jgi:cation:H+ antiporter